MPATRDWIAHGPVATWSSLACCTDVKQVCELFEARVNQASAGRYAVGDSGFNHAALYSVHTCGPTPVWVAVKPMPSQQSTVGALEL